MVQDTLAAQASDPLTIMLNGSQECGNCTAALEFPHYIQTAATFVIALLLALGTVGNLLVPLVVCKTKDLRNSTNLFLINLSVSDLLVLLVCMPTALVELHSQPEVWILGEGMCESFLEPLCHVLALQSLFPHSYETGNSSTRCISCITLLIGKQCAGSLQLIRKVGTNSPEPN